MNNTTHSICAGHKSCSAVMVLILNDGQALASAIVPSSALARRLRFRECALGIDRALLPRAELTIGSSAPWDGTRTVLFFLNQVGRAGRSSHPRSRR